VANLNNIGYNATRAYGAMGGSRTLQNLTRIGFACKGVVYFLIGLLALMAAFGEGGDTTDQKGAIERISTQPFGGVALLLVAVGMFAYAAWRMISAVKDTEGEGHDGKGIGKRLTHFFSGLIHASIGVYALRILIGDGGPGGEATQTWTARALQVPAGKWLIIALGVAIIAGGFVQMREAISESFMKHLRTMQMSGDEKRWAVRAGKWGYSARGVVFAIMGIFLMFAGLRANPQEARGLEGVLDTIATKPFGQIMLAFVAAGLACYGVYCFVEAKYRRVNV
jgi:hypothetical protein